MRDTRNSSGRLNSKSLCTPIFPHQCTHQETRVDLPSLKRDCINMMMFSCRSNRTTIQMLLVNEIIFKMATNELQSNTSDFSIDHILNRAGDRFVRSNKCDHYETLVTNSSGSSSGDESNGCDNFERNCYRNGYVDSERFVEIPAFDWLNYTRYNMPRISRKWIRFKHGDQIFYQTVHTGPTKPPARRTPGRLPRIPFTPLQLNELENAYKTATYLSTEDANKLAKRLELTGVRVKIWFQNRRARDRRERRDSKNIVIERLSDEEEIIVS